MAQMDDGAGDSDGVDDTVKSGDDDSGSGGEVQGVEGEEAIDCQGNPTRPPHLPHPHQEGRWPVSPNPTRQ